MVIRIALCAAALLAPGAIAQSFNLDISAPVQGNPAPSSAYGGAAGQPGVWNLHPSNGQALSLVDLAGQPTTVTATPNSGSTFGSTITGVAGDDGLLMLDFFECDPVCDAVWTLQGLAPGDYVVFTYAWLPSYAMDVHVAGSIDPVETVVAQSWPGAHVRGGTFARHRVAISAGQSLVVRSEPFGGSGGSVGGVVNGIQVVKVDSAQSFCAGDGTLADHTTPCPCGNDGAPSHGCASGANANGALLTSSGNVWADEVVLAASGMPVTALALYLQHDAFDDRVFHDGVLCASGSLLRLRARASVGGASTFPDATLPQDATLTLAQRGGVTRGSGVVRFYSVFYRTPAATFCPPATANVTNGLRITW